MGSHAFLFTEKCHCTLHGTTHSEQVAGGESGRHGGCLYFPFFLPRQLHLNQQPLSYSPTCVVCCLSVIPDLQHGALV